MKIKHFFATALLAMLFAGCSKDSIDQTEVDNGGVIDPTGTGWVSLQVGTPTQPFNTRALHDPDIMDGTAAETTVTEFMAIFFTDAGNLTTAKLIGRGDDEFGNPNQPNGDHGEAFQVPAASKRIFIAANPSGAFKARVNAAVTALPTVVTTFATLNAVLTDTETPLTEITATGKFMMTNAKGGLEPSNSDGTDKNLVLYNSKSNAEASPLAINVDRVVAKVRVFLSYTGDLSDNANIASPGWILNVTNKKFFPASQRVATWNEGSVNAADGGAPRNSFITPFDQYRIGSYRIDPNYATQPDFAPPAQYNVEYNYIYDAATVAPAAWNAMNTNATAGAGGQEYCLENTQPADFNIWAYTTQAVLKAEFLPKGLRVPKVLTDIEIVAPGALYNVSADGVVGGEVQTGTDWIMMSDSYGNDGYYTWDLLMLWLQEELTYKYLLDDATNSIVNNPTLSNALNAYLVGIVAGAVTITDGTAPMTLGDAQTAAATIVTAFKAKKAAVVAKGAFRVGSMSYYKGGVSYYPIMIKHDNNDAANVINELGEFGVVRNSVYDIHISKINNPGYPNFPQPTQTPDEDNQYWLSVKIDVNPWTWYTQTEQL